MKYLDRRWTNTSKRNWYWLTEYRSKIYHHRQQQNSQWAMPRAREMQEAERQATKQDGFVSGKASRTRIHTKNLLFLDDSLLCHVLQCWNLRTSISKTWMQSLMTRPILHRSKLSNSTNNLGWLYRQSWQAAMSFLKTLLPNALKIIFFFFFT